MAAESTPTPVWRSPRFRLRPPVFGVLLLTAVATLAAAAISLLSPLRSTLRADSIALGESALRVHTAQLAATNVGRDGGVVRQLAEFSHENGATYVLWSSKLRRLADSDSDAIQPAQFIAPVAVRQAFGDSRRTPYTLNGSVLVVAASYTGQAGQAPLGHDGRSVFVLEMIRHLDFGATASSLIRNALLYAALVGLGVVILLGIAFSVVGIRRA